MNFSSIFTNLEYIQNNYLQNVSKNDLLISINRIKCLKIMEIFKLKVVFFYKNLNKFEFFKIIVHFFTIQNQFAP